MITATPIAAPASATTPASCRERLPMIAKDLQSGRGSVAYFGLVTVVVF
jgi:hypothetical protein